MTNQDKPTRLKGITALRALVNDPHSNPFSVSFRHLEMATSKCDCCGKHTSYCALFVSYNVCEGCWSRAYLDYEPATGELMTLGRAMAQVVKEHGGVRNTERALGLDKSYISRLMNGKKTAPSAETLEKLGLRAVPRYERIKA